VPLLAEQRSLLNKLGDESSSFALDKSVGARFSCICGFAKESSLPPHAQSLAGDMAESTNADSDSNYTAQRQENSADERDSISCGTRWRAHDPDSVLILCGFDCCAILGGGFCGGIFLYRRRRWLGYLCIGLGVGLCGIGSLLAGWGWAWGTYLPKQKDCENPCGSHGSEYCNTTSLFIKISIERLKSPMAGMNVIEGIRGK
jgi:hypothetical protein